MDVPLVRPVGRPRAERDARFKAMILYLCVTSEGDARFGVLKLNKILFLADFAAYTTLGHAITREEYYASPQGPELRAMPSVLREMEEPGAIGMRTDTYYGLRQKRPMALRHPDLSLFSAFEIALVDSIVKDMWRLAIAEMADSAYGLPAGPHLALDEAIPYEASLVCRRVLTPDEELAAMAFADKRSCMDDSEPRPRSVVWWIRRSSREPAP